MNELLQKLKEWIKVIQAALLGAIIIETILVIVIGIASNKIDGFNYWTGILISCAIIYLFLVTIKAAYQIKFPVSIIDELLSKKELEEKNKLFERQKAINEFIDKTISALNNQTCYIDLKDENEHLCDEELGQRLKDLLNPIISYTDVLLDTSVEKQFTMGIHFEEYKKFPSNYDDIEVSFEFGPYIFDQEKISDNGIIVLNDELNLFDLIPKKLVDLDRVADSSYEIQTAIKRTLNNRLFNKQVFNNEEQNFTIICSEIYEACSEEIFGVFFIIYKNEINLPEDISDVLGIFNRIIANYVTKYNSCIIDKIISKKRNH